MSLKIITLFFIFVGGIFELQASDEVTWEPLKKGDKIHLFASGFAVEKDVLEKAKAIIKGYGYDPIAPDDLIMPQPQGYANAKKYRGEHLQTLLLDPEVKVLWAVRGGRGTSSILPYLEDLKPLSSLNSKRIIGFSDITALHLWGLQHDLFLIHGVNLSTNSEIATIERATNERVKIVNEKTSILSIIKILTGETQKLEYDLSPINEAAQSKVSITAKVVGGNLSLIQRNIATSTSLHPENCILFLEDIGEAPTQFLEVMTHFERMNLFDGVQAIILGDFSAKQESKIIKDFQEVFKLFGTEMDDKHIPIFSSSLFGHGDYNEPLPLNIPATIMFESKDKATLHIALT